MSVLASTVQSHLQAKAPQMIIDAVGRKNAMMGFFKKRTVAGGDGPEWRVNVTGTGNAASYGDGDAEPASVAQTWVKAKLNWKRSWVPLRIERSAIEESQNVYLIGDLYQSELEANTSDLGNALDEQLMGSAASNSKDIDGIQDAIKSSGTYAGINRSTYSNWASDATDFGAALTVAELQTTASNLRNSPRLSNWTHVLCGPAMFNTIGDLFADTTNGTNIQTVPLSGAAGLTFEGGYSAIKFQGRPVVEIPGYAADRLDFIKYDDFEIQFIREFQIDPFKIEGDSLKTKVTVGLNLVCRHPGRQGYLYT